MSRTVCGVCGWDKCQCKTHPGYVIGAHWLETAYSRACAGESEAEVLADYGYRRCAVNQRATQFCGLLEVAVKAEREACAKICEDAAQRWRDAGWDDYSMLLKDAAHQLRLRNPS